MSSGAVDGLSEGYAQQAGISVWPTTLFVDADGQVRFEHQGATRALIEEFSWRIDALRAERGRTR